MTDPLDILNSSDDEGRRAAIEKIAALRTRFNKRHGEQTLQPAANFSVPDVIPTGFPEIDNKVLVIGGLPRGRAIEVGGETSAGKSTLVLNMCKQAVDRGLSLVYSDNEGTVTYEYGEKIGLKRDSYLIMPAQGIGGPEYFDQILELIEENTDVVVIDSLFGLQSMEAIEAGMTKNSMYTDQSIPKLTARFARQLLGGWRSKLNPGTDKNPNIVKHNQFGTTLIIVNHLNMATDGSGKKETGQGEKIKFLYTIRLWLERLSVGKDPQRDENGDIIYTRVKISTNKNKLAPPFRKAIMFIDNPNGRFVSDSAALLDLAKRKKIVFQSGAWFKWTESFLEEISKEDLNLFNPSLYKVTQNEEFTAHDKTKSFQGSQGFVDFMQSIPELESYILGN